MARTTRWLRRSRPSTTLPEGFTAIGVVADVADVELLEAPGVTVGGRIPRGSGGHDHFTG